MIFTTGTVYDYVKNLELQQKWKQKQQALGIIKSPSTVKSPLQMLFDTCNKDTISSKISNGSKLTSAEMEYLSKNEPGLYAKAVRVKHERERYKRELKRCRTKDEVLRVNMSKIASFDSELKTARYSGSSCAADDIQTRFNNIEDEHNEFLNSDAYQKLKWENEESAERARQRKADETHRRKNAASPVLKSRERICIKA